LFLHGRGESDGPLSLVGQYGGLHACSIAGRVELCCWFHLNALAIFREQANPAKAIVELRLIPHCREPYSIRHRHVAAHRSEHGRLWLVAFSGGPSAHFRAIVRCAVAAILTMRVEVEGFADSGFFTAIR